MLRVTAAINAVASEIFNCRLQVIPAAATNFINKFYDCGISINATNYFEVNAKYCEVNSLQNFGTMYTLNHRGLNGFVINTNRYIAINLSNNTFSNIENSVSFLSNVGFYSVGPWTSGLGQYSGQVDINQNTFQPFIPGSPLTNTYIDKAITASNVTGAVHFISSTQTVNTNNNTVNNVFKGIRCNNWQKKSVITNSNVITILPIPTLPAATQYGISHANNIPANPLSNNIVSNVVTGYGILNANLVGIATQLCNNQLVKCNTTSNITMGIYFAGNEMPTVFDHNTFNNSGTNRHKYAFVLDNNGFIGQQGSAGAPSDNRWLPAGMIVSSGGLKSMDADEVAYAEELKQLLNSYTASGSSFVASEWMMQQFIYNELKEHGGLLGDSLLNAFYAANENAAFGLFNNFDAAIQNLDYVQATAYNNSIVPANIIEQNQQTFNAIYLTHNDSTAIYSAEDSTNLNAIAVQCPMEGGNAVVQSRNLLMSIQNRIIEFTNDCDISIPISRQVVVLEEDTHNMKLYPNPNNGNMTLECNLLENETGTLDIYDVTGKLIQTYKLAENSKIVIINAQSLPAGLYLYQINVNGREIIKEKLTIVK